MMSRSAVTTSSRWAIAARSSTLLMLGDASPPVTRWIGWSSQSKKRRWISSASQPPYEVPTRPLLGDQHVVGLADALADGVPVDAGAVEPAQVDDLGVDAADLVDRVEDVVGHGEVGEDRDVDTGAPDGGLADRQAVVEVVDRAVAGRRVEVDVLEDQHRILAAQRAVHQPDVVEGRRRRHDPPPGVGGEDAGRVHGVLGAVAGALRDLAAEHDRDTGRCRRTCAGPCRSG